MENQSTPQEAQVNFQFLGDTWEITQAPPIEHIPRRFTRHERLFEITRGGKPDGPVRHVVGSVRFDEGEPVGYLVEAPRHAMYGIIIASQGLKRNDWDTQVQLCWSMTVESLVSTIATIDYYKTEEARAAFGARQTILRLTQSEQLLESIVEDNNEADKERLVVFPDYYTSNINMDHVEVKGGSPWEQR